MEHLYGGFPGHNFASTLSSDNKTWFMVANSAPHKFYIGNGTWNDFEFSQPLTNKTGLRAATDPASGMIYVINGLSTNGSYSMLQYDIATDTSSSIPMDPRMVGLSDSAVVWSTARRSMLVHGGVLSDSGEVQQGLYEFDPDEGVGKWTLLSDKGDIPGPRRGHCLVPAYGGSKMILFGGLAKPELGHHVSGGIYSLDILTLIWTKLTDPGELFARAYHACAVSNDMFVSWGGSDSYLHAINDNVTLVYNLKKNVWQTSYSPVPEEGLAEPPFGEEPFGVSSSVLQAAIIVTVIGCTGIVLVFGYIFCRRKQRRRKPFSAQSAGSMAADHRRGSSRSISTREHPFLSLEALETGEPDNGFPMSAVGLQQEQQLPHLAPKRIQYTPTTTTRMLHRSPTLERV
ncbi:hypothetical protein BGZ72_010344 [Mortierella alpina]|nr:hypothetical protein BGZ72_010344 [Mortierella alpina]